MTTPTPAWQHPGDPPPGLPLTPRELAQLGPIRCVTPDQLAEGYTTYEPFLPLGTNAHQSHRYEVLGWVPQGYIVRDPSAIHEASHETR